MFLQDNEESNDQTNDFSEEIEESSDQLDESANEGEQEEADQPLSEESTLVEVNGEKLSLEDLKKGYMREADYRRKTQELARLRNEALAQPTPQEERNPQEVEALKALDKLGVAKRSDVENIVRSMLAQQQIMSEREKVRMETGLDDDMLDAAQFMSVRSGLPLSETAARLAGQKKVIQKKSISVAGGITTGGSTARSSKPTPQEIAKMDPGSKEFAQVVDMMERGEL